MTEDALKAIEKRAAALWVSVQEPISEPIGRMKGDVATLGADVRRLRGLIMDAAPKRVDGPRGACARTHKEPCPWCNRYPCETAPGGHSRDCPAFTFEGEVR